MNLIFVTDIPFVQAYHTNFFLTRCALLLPGRNLVYCHLACAYLCVAQAVFCRFLRA